MRALPKPNEIYKHFKGNCYRIITLATETETREKLVVYQALYGDMQVYARELSMFLSPVDRVKYPDVEQQWRFELLDTAAVSAPVQEKADEDDTQESLQLDPMLLKYLDADTYEDRLQILVAMKDRLTNEMINTMAIAVDVEIAEGDIAERYEQLKYCLLTRERFECNRLR